LLLTDSIGSTSAFGIFFSVLGFSSPDSSAYSLSSSLPLGISNRSPTLPGASATLDFFLGARGGAGATG